MISHTPVNGCAATAGHLTSRSGRLSVACWPLRLTSALGVRFHCLIAPLTLALVVTLAETRAAIPAAALSDPLYAKGYLVVTYYAGVSPVGGETDSTRTTRTININVALRDAYNNNLALYFPPGTYQVNDTLRAYTALVNPGGSGFAVPRNAVAVVGSTLKARPMIRLVPAAGNTDFNLPGTPRPVFAFKNFDVLPPLHQDGGADDPASGYFQMLRGIDIDCGGKAGAIGLYFNQAQNSSIENVKVTATNAHTGILGLPARGWGAVNIEVVGGQYGIDTNGTSNAGSVIAGVTLTDQTEAAFRHNGFVPVTLVGFKITSTTGSTKPVLTIQPSGAENACGINLVDGSIEMDVNPSVAVIDNVNANNFYARNVYIKTSTSPTSSSNLIKSGTLATVTAIGVWKRIDEYSYCTPAVDNPSGATGRASYRQINTTLTAGAGQMAPALTPSLFSSDVPADLASRHAWVALPSVDDPDAIDVTAHGITPGTEADSIVVSSASLQALIDQHRKIFLPKGVYRLTAPGITLRADTILFGAARSLTRMETDPAWNPTVETPVIQAVNDANATTYLGDLTIGVEVRPGTTFTELADSTHDFFTAVKWQAGRGSMVHMGQPYRIPDGNNPTATQDHSLLKITGSGGGRWYFAGCIKTGTSDNPAYRILEVAGTSEPLSFYGLNLEHALGSAVFGSFTGASNVRIYSVKSEFDGTGNDPRRGDSVLLSFSNNSSNIALYGSGALRNAVKNHGVIEFINSNNVLAALIAPQNNEHDNGQIGLGPNNHTLRQTVSGNTHGVEYPDIVALYKRGTIDDSAMTHGNPFYGPEQVFFSATEDGWVRESTETSNVGGSLLNNGTGAQALSVGDSSIKQQYKSILSFDTSLLPPASDAVPYAATLEMRRGFASGNINSLGLLQADIRTGNFGANALENADFQAAATATNVIPSFPIPSANGDLTVGALDATGLDAINLGGITQMRVRFSSDDNNNGTADLLGFYSGENSTEANRPVLRVQYRQP